MRIKVSALDRLFSRYIRMRDRWMCQRCGRKFVPPDTQGLDCSHYWSRRAKSTRFDEANCDALCMGCHTWFGQHREGVSGYAAWKIRRMGDRAFALLQLRYNHPKKPDLKLIKIYLTKRIKELEAEI